MVETPVGLNIGGTPHGAETPNNLKKFNLDMGSDLIKSLLTIREALNNSIIKNNQLLSQKANPWEEGAGPVEDCHHEGEQEEEQGEQSMELEGTTAPQSRGTASPAAPKNKRKRIRKPIRSNRVSKSCSESEYYSDFGQYRAWPMAHSSACNSIDCAVYGIEKPELSGTAVTKDNDSSSRSSPNKIRGKSGGGYKLVGITKREATLLQNCNEHKISYLNSRISRAASMIAGIMGAGDRNENQQQEKLSTEVVDQGRDEFELTGNISHVLPLQNLPSKNSHTNNKLISLWNSWR